MVSEHTPGPWEARLSPTGQVWRIDESADTGVAGIAHVPSGKANANLIAAAPELLAALEAALGHIYTLEAELSHGNLAVTRAARFAIAKARKGSL